MSNPYRYGLQIKSISTDLWRDPVSYFPDLDEAAEHATDWFQQDGWYSRIIDTFTGDILFIDYRWTEEGEARFE